jgi:hypothetical protein
MDARHTDGALASPGATASSIKPSSETLMPRSRECPECSEATASKATATAECGQGERNAAKFRRKMDAVAVAKKVVPSSKS